MSGGAEREARNLLGARIGMRFDAATARRLARAVSTGSVAAGLDAEAYVATARDDDDVLNDLIDRVTVPETSFFRHPEQFNAIARRLAAWHGEHLTAWSAGCSSGQEPYSLAMLLAENGVAGWDVIASDVSRTAVERTAAASWHERELRGLASWRQQLHLEPDGDRYRPQRRLRERVRTTRTNLLSDPLPVATASCHLVLCRNVLIYLRKEECERVLDRIRQVLHPDGLLFVGGTEALWHLDVEFEAVDLGGIYGYHHITPRGRRHHAPAPPPPPARVPEPPREDPRPPLSVERLLDSAEAALRADDVRGAVGLYRDATRLDPDAVLPHALLGLALEQAGDPDAARSAFQSAWEKLGRADKATLEPGLEGYRAEELAHMLIGRLGSPA